MTHKSRENFRRLTKEASRLTGQEASKIEAKAWREARRALNAKEAKDIREAFKENIEAIEKATPGLNEKQRMAGFADQVIGKALGQGISIKQAIKKELHSADYFSKAEVFKGNAIEGISSDPDAYKVWRKLTQHRKIDKDNFKYVGNNTYEYTFGKKKKHTIVIRYEKYLTNGIRVFEK